MPTRALYPPHRDPQHHHQAPTSPAACCTCAHTRPTGPALRPCPQPPWASARPAPILLSAEQLPLHPPQALRLLHFGPQGGLLPPRALRLWHHHLWPLPPHAAPTCTTQPQGTTWDLITPASRLLPIPHEAPHLLLHLSPSLDSRFAYSLPLSLSARRPSVSLPFGLLLRLPLSLLAAAFFSLLLVPVYAAASVVKLPGAGTQGPSLVQCPYRCRRHQWARGGRRSCCPPAWRQGFAAPTSPPPCTGPHIFPRCQETVTGQLAGRARLPEG